jgi:phosphogluconate dehydratase
MMAALVSLVAGTGLSAWQAVEARAQSDAAWRAKVLADEQAEVNGHDLGRELFAGMRRNVSTAEEGGITWR